MSRYTAVAQDVMTEGPITTPPEATIYEVGELMDRHQVRGVPVTHLAAAQASINAEVN